jgi:hypothetical protein
VPNRLWMFNPGCATEDCCPDDDEHCGEICLTVNRSEDGGPLEGATVSGAGGECTTDAEGKCCIPIDDIGTYEFEISHEDYDPETIEVSADECNGSTTINPPPVTLTPTVETGDYCHTVRVLGCECFVQGATVTITAIDASWSETRITNGAGEVRICIDSPMERGVHITVSAPLYITQVSGLVNLFDGGLTIVNLVTQDINDRWCWGGTPPECRSLLPNTLTVTLGGTGWRQDRTSVFGGDYTTTYAGQTMTLTRITPLAGNARWLFCGAVGNGRTAEVEYRTIIKWSHQCHDNTFQGSLVVNWVSSCNPGHASIESFQGSPIAGTDHCPISASFTDHNTANPLLGTMTATVSE